MPCEQPVLNCLLSCPLLLLLLLLLLQGMLTPAALSWGCCSPAGWALWTSGDLRVSSYQ
jgi:hypothetical protein